MKQLVPALLGLASLLLASFFSVAQQPAVPTHPCMPNEIETDPPQASNTQYPIRRNTFNWYNGPANGGRMYNINWTVPGNPIIFMPWEQSDNARLTQILGQHDTPAQGWQLIKRDLGYNDAGVALGAIKNPYVIIYNRYTGVLRVFVATGEIATGYTFAQIKLSFNPIAARKAGTLNRATGLGIALEDTAPGAGLEFLSVTSYQNEFGKWFYADFPMEYDPCTCLFDSKLQVQINLVDVLDVQLRGLSQGTLMTANATTGNSFESSAAQQSAFSFKKAVNTLEAGQKTYKTIDGFAGGVRNLIGIQASNTGTSATAKLGALSSLQTALKSSSFLKAGLSAAPWIGAAVSMLDFFLGGGKEETAPMQPLALQPMTIEFSTETKGTITASRPYSNPTFNNPGTPSPPTRPEEYPYYNEAMGVFSLLRRPVVDVVSLPIYDGYEYQIRFHDMLRFAVNPASGLRVQDMQVALVTNSYSHPNYTNGSFSEHEGVIMVPGATPIYPGAETHSFRTPYWNSGCLTSLTHSLYVESPDYFGWNIDNMYVKLIINLTRVVPSATAQNVLLVLKYPVSINMVSEFPSNIPTCASPNAEPEPAPLAELTNFCNSAEYRAATVLARPAGAPASTKANTSTPHRPDALTAYPNPAADQVTLRYTVEQPGPVRVEIRDALGRTVTEAVNRADHPAGTFDAAVSTAQLPAGVYHCTLVAPTYRQTTKLVVAR